MTDRTILEALASSVGYKVPVQTIETIAARRALDTEAEFSAQVALSEPYRLCEADILRYMVTVPCVWEGCVRVSVSGKELLVAMADAIYAACGEPQIGSGALPAAPQSCDGAGTELWAGANVAPISQEAVSAPALNDEGHVYQ